MKLDYKILWLDDQINDFIEDEIIEDVENFLIEQGFRPQIRPVSRSEDFFNLLDNTFDLILTDYHLNDINGDEVIKRIRSQDFSVMTEVLFYTAKADLKDTDKISRVSFLETNTLLGDHREEVLRATINLIELTIKKFQDIVAMRGMIVQEASSLDVEMESILKKMIDKSSNPDELIEVIKMKYIQSNNEFNLKMDSQTEVDNVLRILGATHRWRAIVRNLGSGTIKSVMSDYENDIILIRNKFAHAELISEDGRQFFRYKKDGLDFNQEFCQKIRMNLIKHKANLDALMAELES